MRAAERSCYTIISVPRISEYPDERLLKEWLEKGDTGKRIYALKQVIQLILNGQKLQCVLIPIIRFVLAEQDHTIKKLLLIFWEILPKTTADGELLPEMILVCDALRKDLLHPNQYICGSTLRFLCKLKEHELLEPLVSVVRNCLKSPHTYVRRNAVLAIFAIYKNVDFLIPDTPELIANFLQTEIDESCKRTAFISLIHVDQERALNYLNFCIDDTQSFGGSLQLVIVELVYKVCCANPGVRSRFICYIYKILNSNIPSVRYAAAQTLVALSKAPTSVRTTVNCYIELITNESDDVKLVVLDDLAALFPEYGKVLQDYITDILQFLVASNLEVCKKTLYLAQHLLSSGNVENVVLIMKKKISKTYNIAEHENMLQYRKLLIHFLHSCCIRYPDVAHAVIPTLVEFLSDDEQTAADVVAFIKEAMQMFENLRALILHEVLEVFSSLQSSEIHRQVLWIVGECCCTVEDIQRVITEIHQCIGNIPLVDTLEKAAIDRESVAGSDVASSMQKFVVPDEASLLLNSTVFVKNKQKTPFRDYFMEGKYFIGATLSSVLAKLSLKYITIVSDPKKQNIFIAKAMLIMASIIRLGKSGLTPNMNEDCLERILQCLALLGDSYPLVFESFSRKICNSASILTSDEVGKLGNQKNERKVFGNVDDPIIFGQFAVNTSVTEDIFEQSLSKATGIIESDSEAGVTSQLNRVIQLTGFSDEVYAEAYVKTNQDDIILEFLVVNQTQDTLQDCAIELATSSGLKLVEKPPTFTLLPGDFCNVEVFMKTSSGDNIIYGNITYTKKFPNERSIVVLNDTRIDVNCILPMMCTTEEFQTVWGNSIWRTEVDVDTNLMGLTEYLRFLISTTNMKCTTPEEMLSGECDFLAANMYGRSVFGGQIMANVCIEKNPLTPETPVTGHVQIRSNKSNLALTLKQKIISAQKSTKLPVPI